MVLHQLLQLAPADVQRGRRLIHRVDLPHGARKRAHPCHGNLPIFASTNHRAKNPPIMATTQICCLVLGLSFIPPLPVMEEW